MKPQPLTDAEFERLNGLLGRFDNKRPMNLEQLDGFLAALICGPEIVRPSEYLPVICGNDMVLEDSFGAQSVLQDFLSLIMRHWNVIADTLHSGDVFLPMLLEDDDGVTHANDWRLETRPLDHATTFRRTIPKIGRNDPCPCGSGKKFKQCCGRTTLH